MTPVDTARRHLPILVLAAVPLLLALRFGGYHPRHSGWVLLALTGWACIEAARGRLSAPHSVSGIATLAMVALVGWTVASVTWADASRHDAWVEGMRAAGYGATFVLGGALLAAARAHVRFTALAGAGIALLALAAAARLRWSDAPLQSFVGGRLDWPIGYAPGLAGLCLFGSMLLLGASCGAEQRWERSRRPSWLLAGGAALGGAGLCAAVALLAQSRGTLPAVAVGAIVSLVATPRRSSWLLRAAAVAIAIFAARGPLGATFTSQFDLRQAQFTEGADEAALLEAAERAARVAGTTSLVLLLGLAVVGMALVRVGSWSSRRLASLERRVGMSLALPVSVAVVALAGSLLLLTADRERSPAAWMANQWSGCVDPPERPGDPGSGRSHFANTGTGRCDYYRVAIGAAAERPLLGLGAGNFRTEYVQERRTDEEPRFVHSLPLQLLAELGIVGALLGAVVLGCVGWAGWRFVASGPARDATFAGALGGLGYWLAHASIDWLWQLPGVSLLPVALAGGLVACVSPAQRRVAPMVAAPIAAGVLLGCVALILPVTMADRELRRARDPQLRERDLEAALEATRDAQSFDPTWAEPVITEAVLHLAAGRRRAAAIAARRAVQLEPRSWSVQYRASGLLGLEDTQKGREAFLAARRLNPRLPASVSEEDLAEEDLAGRAGTDPDALQNPDS